MGSPCDALCSSNRFCERITSDYSFTNVVPTRMQASGLRELSSVLVCMNLGHVALGQT